MSWGKVIIASAMTFAFIVFGMMLLGFSQMGDCSIEPTELRDCVAAQKKIWNALSAILVAGYLATLWLIFRRRKAL